MTSRWLALVRIGFGLLVVAALVTMISVLVGVLFLVVAWAVAYAGNALGARAAPRDERVATAG